MAVDYQIIGVNREDENDSSSAIKEVLTEHEGKRVIFQRDEVIDLLIELEDTFHTKGPKGQRTEVTYYFVNGEKFIKTENNRIACDNLENLPGF